MTKVELEGDELLALARLDVAANRLDTALLKIKEGLAQQDSPDGLIALGAKVYAQLGLYEKAIPLFQRYLEIRPGEDAERFELGMAYYDTGSTDDALRIWGEVLRNSPTHPPALFYSSQAFAKSGDLESAKRNLDVLLKSAPVSNLYFERGKELLASLSEMGAERRGPMAS